MPPPRLAVIGAGMAGVLSAIELRRAGYSDFTVYEKAETLGGTWRENTYPGIACDVPSHYYSYSFALNPDWSHRFAGGAEIQAYFERVARDYDVLPSIRFGDEVVKLEWKAGRWQLETASGHRDAVDAVIAATGVLHHPNWPEIPGLADFAGPCFHSARWDHDVPLEDARVGVVGTGSSAVQITGALAPRVRKYLLFQRTAQWIMPYENRPYSEEERAENRVHPERLRQHYEGLGQLFLGFADGLLDANSDAMRDISAACLANLENSVRDPELRERLRPSYQAGCKRLIFADNFYEALQQPQSELVTSGIERVEAGGVRTTDGVLHELDVLVLATGFRVDRFLRPIQVVGPGGTTLEEIWAKRPLAYYSIAIPGLPNLFMLNGPNGPVGNFSLIDIAERQFAYILQLLERLSQPDCRAIDVRRDATLAYEAERSAATHNTIWTSGCNSWYLDDRGIPATWPWGYERFREAMDQPRFEDYDLG